MQVALRVVSGPYSGRTFKFDQHDTFLIGRAETAHLRLPEDKFFSRHHCLLEIAPPKVFLRDLGSLNGTFVNGQRVPEAYLKSGDRIQMGETVVTVEVTVEPLSPEDETTRDAERPPLAKTQPSIIMVECLNCGKLDEAEASSPDEKLTYLCEDCREELRRQPQPIPGYDVVRILGRGGMGCVMLGRHQETGHTVAIKTLLPEIAVSDQALKRFMREIDVAAALDHPHIVRFIDRGTSKGVVYLITEFVEGTDAAKLADSRGGRLPCAEAIAIIAQSLDALAYAHQKGFIHRDIKDQNILVAGQWPDYSAKLTDFGLAKSFTQSGMSGITMAGEMAGSLAYMPPEQIRDFRNVKPQSDLYSMGMTAYSLLSGHLALDVTAKSSMSETVKAIFDRPIIPLRGRAPDVPESVAQVVEIALSKDPARRWQSAEAMLKALLHSAT